MKRFVKKCADFLERLWKNFHSDIHFSPYFAWLRVVDVVGGRLGFQDISQHAHKRKDKWIAGYLQTQLEEVVQRYREDTYAGEYVPNAPIWVCWWTGLETAPELVKRCVASTIKHAGAHPVHLITRENYEHYLEIPSFMLEKVETGTMGFAHLADYIRVKLLAQRGGLWLDATMFCSGEIPDICFALPVFTCKGPVGKCAYVSDYRWVTFCLGGWKGNIFYRYLVDAFETYWRKNDRAVDYLFFDHIILVGYEAIGAVRKLLDQIPDNNIHRDDLQAAMNAALPADAFDSVLREDTVLYKLSWRERYSDQTETGEKSIYRYFIQDKEHGSVQIEK